MTRCLMCESEIEPDDGIPIGLQADGPLVCGDDCLHGLAIDGIRLGQLQQVLDRVRSILGVRPGTGLIDAALRIVADSKALSIDEYAKRMGVSQKTVRRWIDDDGLPSFRIGSVLRIRVEDAEIWERSRVRIVRVNARASMGTAS